jgi:hypothetical protein
LLTGRGPASAQLRLHYYLMDRSRSSCQPHLSRVLPFGFVQLSLVANDKAAAHFFRFENGVPAFNATLLKPDAAQKLGFAETYFRQLFPKLSF